MGTRIHSHSGDVPPREADRRPGVRPGLPVGHVVRRPDALWVAVDDARSGATSVGQVASPWAALGMGSHLSRKLALAPGPR